MRTIVAIDGPAGAGKSTVARLVAERLGLAYVDTGATYRIVAHRALAEGVALDDEPGLADLARRVLEGCSLHGGTTLHLNGAAVGEEIRTPEVSEATSRISALPAVRRVLVDFQRRLVPPPGAVVEGRDIGTVVWPEAGVKVYLDAVPDVRAQRRVAQTSRADAVETEVHERDARDAARPVSAMKPAPDAVVIDTSELSAAQVADRVVALAREPDRDPLYGLLRAVLTGITRVLLRLDIDGAEVPARGPVILAPNHRSLIDIPVAAATTRRKVCFMAKQELFSNPLAARLLTRLGTFPVQRGKPDRSALQRSLALLDDGQVVGIFPEGTRMPDARFAQPEEGFAYIALRSGAPIVPVAISGTEAVFPPGRKLPHLVRVRVRVGEPFRLGDRVTGLLPRGRVREATEEARRRLEAVMDELEPRRGGT